MRWDPSRRVHSPATRFTRMTFPLQRNRSGLTRPSRYTVRTSTGCWSVSNMGFRPLVGTIVHIRAAWKAKKLLPPRRSSPEETHQPLHADVEEPDQDRPRNHSNQSGARRASRLAPATSPCSAPRAIEFAEAQDAGGLDLPPTPHQRLKAIRTMPARESHSLSTTRRTGLPRLGRRSFGSDSLTH